MYDAMGLNFRIGLFSKTCCGASRRVEIFLFIVLRNPQNHTFPFGANEIYLVSEHMLDYNHFGHSYRIRILLTQVSYLFANDPAVLAHPSHLIVCN